MRLRTRFLLAFSLMTLLTPLFTVPRAQAILAFGLIDRKFPVGQFCPIETRGSRLVSFTAPANGAVRITFAADNFYPTFDEPDEFGNFVFEFNDPAIDNVFVMTQDQWLAHQSNCDYPCFFDDFNNDPDDPGPGVPSYPSDVVSLSELAYAELFLTNPHSAPSPLWESGHWKNGRTAPHDDASASFCESKTDGGSLSLGDATDGSFPVSAAVTVAGLQRGVTYVVFCWFYVKRTRENDSDFPAATLSILVDETSVVATELRSFSALKGAYR